jgi:hypothetical protein
MTTYNATNERVKRQYFAYLADALGHSEQTIDAVAKAIARFEAYTRYKDFKTFHIEQAKAFKRDLADQRGERTGEPLSKATLYATLTALKRFFVWLAGQSGYKSRLLLGCRVLQPLGQGDANREGHPPGPRSDPGADSPRHPIYAHEHRNRAPGPSSNRAHHLDRGARRGHRVVQAEAHRHH